MILFLILNVLCSAWLVYTSIRDFKRMQGWYVSPRTGKIEWLGPITSDYWRGLAGPIYDPLCHTVNYWDVEPPRHPNCRCTFVFKVKTREQILQTYIPD